VSRIVVVALVFATACACAADPLTGYVTASADDRASVVRTIESYFAMRERAAVSGDVTELFNAYPALARNEDRCQGINTESFFAERARLARTQPKEIAPAEITRMSHSLEGRGPIQVYVRAESALAFVHGSEELEYPSGPPSFGEIFVRFDLRRDAGRWVIERTDQQVMGEPAPRTPRP
jgi:hypothetical protein